MYMRILLVLLLKQMTVSLVRVALCHFDDSDEQRGVTFRDTSIEINLKIQHPVSDSIIASSI